MKPELYAIMRDILLSIAMRTKNVKVGRTCLLRVATLYKHQKKLLAVLLAFSLLNVTSEPLDGQTTRPYGRIQFVSSFPDYRVRIVELNGDYRVRIIHSTAYHEGLWEIVNRFADYRIQLVETGEDFTVEFIK